jgi:L-threonylcarbamoyladenylate synthase
MKIIKEYEFDTIINCLKHGGLVIFPSDTVYGALVDATNQMAVDKLINFKNRPYGKPISVFVSDFLMLKDLVVVDKKQQKIIQALLPGCYTLIFPSKNHVCQKLESEKGTLGVRLPNFKPVVELVKQFKKPLTATSANLSGRPACHSIEALLNQLPKIKMDLIDLIVDRGKLPPNKPSTVVDLTTDAIRILRLGDVPFSSTKKFISQSENETKNIARNLFRSFLTDNTVSKKPLTFIIEGELGAGKTIFVKGLASELGINKIISPTFVIYYEYSVKKASVNKFIHIDLYNIQEKEEFSHLGLEDYFQRGNILAIEWGEKSSVFFEEMKKKGKIVYVKINYINEKKRQIVVKN